MSAKLNDIKNESTRAFVARTLAQVDGRYVVIVKDNGRGGTSVNVIGKNDARPYGWRVVSND